MKGAVVLLFCFVSFSCWKDGWLPSVAFLWSELYYSSSSTEALAYVIYSRLEQRLVANVCARDGE